MAERNTQSRSEKLRAKRGSKSKRTPARKPRASQRAYQKMPPVLMRGGLNNMAQNKRKRRGKIPKRRFDIALSSPGVEMRLPAVPAIGLGWRFLSAVLAFGLLMLLYHLWTSPLYQVQEAELEGNHYLSDETINRTLNLYNKPIFLVDPEQIEADLKNAFRGLLVNSTVKIIWPTTVIVTVQERAPVIAWEQDGETRWVDAEGVAFDPIGENDTLIKVSASAPPPIPPGIEDDQTPSQGELNALEELLLSEYLMTPEMAAAIMIMHEKTPKKAYLTYNPRRGLGWHDSKQGWDVYFGVDITNIQEKLIVYRAIKAQLKEDGISPMLISIEHVHAPYYRLEQ